MTNKATRAYVKESRDRWNIDTTSRGHSMVWRLGPNANNRGHAYFFEGDCGHCGATMQIGHTWTSCSGVRDARDVACSGPGTAVLTEIEADRLHELCAPVIAEFAAVVAEIEASRDA